MGDTLISVIVPVYNVKKYISECIDSILAQTYNYFELILVDDGSKDGSGDICENYGKKDERIRVFHKENEGLSSARNKGIDEAVGEYICFVDSDDTLRADYLEKLYNAITVDKSDISICDIQATKLSEENLQKKVIFKMTSADAKKWLYDERTKEYVLMVVAWNKLYSSKIFEGIRYPEGKLHEDEFMIGLVLSKASVISFVPEKLYIYRDNTSGITSDVNRFNIRHFDVIDAYAERINCATNDGDIEFAIVTLKNALYKCARFYRDGKESGAVDFASVAQKRFKNLLRIYGSLLNTKQQMKYRLFLLMPGVFVNLCNP